MWVLPIAVIALILWFFIPHAGRDERESIQRRWKAGGDKARPSETFTNLLEKPPADEPIQPKPVNWTNPHVAVYSVSTATSGAPGNRDPFRFDRVLVATVTKGADWYPGDRMVWTRIFVQPINFAFAGYTVAATDNAMIKVTSVDDTNTRTVSADLGLTIPGLQGPKATVDSRAEHTVKTTADINVEYERLGIDITRGFLRIIRESEVGSDVLGNTKVLLSVTTDPKVIRKRSLKGSVDKVDPDDQLVLLVTGAQLLKGAAELVNKDATITVLPQAQLPHCALRARVWMLYEQRKIDEGSRQYFAESQQVVSLIRDADEPREVEIVSADDVSPAVWSIQILPKPQSTEDAPKFLSARIDKGQWRELVFTDYGLASTLAHWIRTHPGVEVSNLNFNDTAGDRFAAVKKTADECTPGSDPRESKVIYRPREAPPTGLQR
jgi:hypothetical protein